MMDYEVLGYAIGWILGFVLKVVLIYSAMSIVGYFTSPLVGIIVVPMGIMIFVLYCHFSNKKKLYGNDWKDHL